MLALALPRACVARKKARSPQSGQPVILNQAEARALLIKTQTPDYPPIAKVNYIQGSVKLQLLVGKTGKVEAVHVLKGFPLLAAAAIPAVRHWRYKPLIKGCRPTPFVTMARVNFWLDAQHMFLSSGGSQELENLPARPMRDFDRQVHPPYALGLERNTGSAPVVELRVLVSAQGRVIDSKLLRGNVAALKRARKIVQRLRFHPAYWGTLAIPWTTDVNVPIGRPFVHAQMESQLHR